MCVIVIVNMGDFVKNKICFLLPALFCSASMAMSGAEVFVAAKLVDIGSRALFDVVFGQKLTPIHTKQVVQRLNSQMPFKLNEEFYISNSNALAAGVLELDLKSKSFSKEVLTDNEVSVKINRTLAPYLLASFCQPNGFWYQRWLRNEGTLLVRLHSSDGFVVRSYSAQQHDCKVRR